MKTSKRIKMLSICLMVMIALGMSPMVASAATLRITSQPKTSYTSYGGTAKATVKAKGDKLKYTWYIKNAGAKKYTKTSVTKATYTTTMNDKSKNRSVYCVVKDKRGKTIKSKVIVLRMKATITTEPKNVTVKVGNKAVTSIKAKGDGLKYTWYYKNAGAKKYTKSTIKKATYSVTMSDKINGRSIYCVVTDKYGKTDKSKTVVLKKKVEPLTISMQPQNVEASVGDEAGFGIIVTGGTKPYKYNWKYISDGMENWADADGEITTLGAQNILNVIVNEDTFKNRYCCIVTDASGKKVQSKEVWVEKRVLPLSVEVQPQCVTADVGDEVSFSLVMSGGEEPYTYQWQYTYEGTVHWLDCKETWATGATTDTVSFIVEQTDFDYNYVYRCVITDAAGDTVYSDEVYVIQK